MVAGIRLSGQGQKCVIISSGQSALHFSSGSFDLLSSLPDEEVVVNPGESVKKLKDSSPFHPYVKMGTDNFMKLAKSADAFFKDIHVDMYGSSGENHFRVTPMGTLKPTWLTLDNYAVCSREKALPREKIAIFNISGFLDFYPKFIADEFKKTGNIESEIYAFDLPDLKYIRRNPGQLRAPNIARILDTELNTRLLADILNNKSGNSDAIIIPAVIGLYNNDAISYLKNVVEKPIRFIATLPPSVPGIHLQKYLRDYFIKQGGVYMLGDTVQKTKIENGRVTKVYSYNHGDIPFNGKDFILAAGSYFSQGLIAAQGSVYEPVFDLDVSFSQNRQEWYSDNMFDAQGYQLFGVKTDNNFNALYKGEPIENLYVAGAILEGFNPIKEGSGAGVSILSALQIADSITEKSRSHT